MKTCVTGSLLIITLLGTILPSQAEEHASNVDAHIHGLSELMIVMEQRVLEIQLVSPAMNLTGFEHTAKTHEDIQTVENTVARLRQHSDLFVVSGSDCDHVSTAIDLAGLINDEQTLQPKEQKSHEHEHEHEDHSEITATYTYTCKDTTELSAITLDIFKFFPGIHKTHVTWVNQTHQGSKTLTPQEATITLGASW